MAQRQLHEEVESMDMTMAQIEYLTAQRLRQLPLGEDDLYSVDSLEELEDDDLLDPADAGFMLGYLTAEV